MGIIKGNIKTGGIKELHAKRLVSLLKSNKKYYLYIGFQECPYCRDFSETLREFSSYANLPIYYFNLNSGNSKLNESDKKFIEKVLNESVNLRGTPTFLKIEKKKIIAKFEGSQTTIRDLNDIN
ncbi:TPA: PedC/BrcD family bacteriocin maturation disulfide isomerase [Staphylococcus aureus]|nr:PedC/BrcD family bacteriocin maturation disulfide isomerase [Staphylococcus aureus]